MNVKERVMASRLIVKISSSPEYAERIGLKYEINRRAGMRGTESTVDSQAGTNA